MKGIDGGYKLSELLSSKGGQILDLQNEEGWGEKEICTKRIAEDGHRQFKFGAQFFRTQSVEWFRTSLGRFVTKLIKHVFHVKYV